MKEANKRSLHLKLAVSETASLSRITVELKHAAKPRSLGRAYSLDKTDR